MVRISWFALAVATIALLSAACSPAAAPTAAQATGTPQATGAAPSLAPASQPVAIVATIPADLLTVPGHLVICSDLPYPPQEYFDENGNPIGSDIEIGEAIAARLGLDGRDRELGLRHDHPGADRAASATSSSAPRTSTMSG